MDGQNYQKLLLSVVKLSDPPPKKTKKQQQQQTLKHENEQCMLWRCQSLCLEPCQIHFESVRIIDRMIQTPLN